MKEDLKKFREKIDFLDYKLMKILLERFSIVKKIGNIKKNEGLSIYDSNREDIILKKKKKKQ